MTGEQLNKVRNEGWPGLLGDVRWEGGEGEVESERDGRGWYGGGKG